MNKIKFLCAGLGLSLLTACGGGHVGANANRGTSTSTAANTVEVVTRARSTNLSSMFSKDKTPSTTGIAEIIYRDKNFGDLFLLEGIEEDAVRRAIEVSGCTDAVYGRAQRSVQGTHVIVGLANCPAIEARRFGAR